MCILVVKTSCRFKYIEIQFNQFVLYGFCSVGTVTAPYAEKAHLQNHNRIVAILLLYMRRSLNHESKWNDIVVHKNNQR